MAHSDAPSVLYHFSEDPSIRRFVPHVPRTNPDHPPAVWAIDAEHAPLYWFPRDCPRVAVWPRDEVGTEVFRRVFTTTSTRLHAMELTWLARLRTTTIHRYTFDAADFSPWSAASGQWIAERAVEPIDVSSVGDLLDEHVRAEIELRLVTSLWPLIDLAVDPAGVHPWDFSIVRKAGVVPRDRALRGQLSITLLR